MTQRYCAFRDCFHLGGFRDSDFCLFHFGAAEPAAPSLRERLHHSGALRATHRALERIEGEQQLAEGSDPERYARALAGVLRHWFGPEAVLVAQATARHLSVIGGRNDPR